MADIVDKANDYAEQAREAAIAECTRYTLPAGEAGVCDYCDEHSPRLVGGACAPCRDELGIG